MTITTPRLDPEFPIVMPPPTIIEMVMSLADCLCGMLAVNGAGPTCWCGVYPGAAVSWEYCGECSGNACGMGWVRPAGIFPFSTFPVAAVDVTCQLPLAWVVEVGALRCLPMTQDGNIVSPDEMGDVAIGTMLDARAIYAAVQCCDVLIGKAALQQYVPVGPQGGCVGGYWNVFLDVPSV